MSTVIEIHDREALVLGEIDVSEIKKQIQGVEVDRIFLIYSKSSRPGGHYERYEVKLNKDLRVAEKYSIWMD